MKLQLKNNEIFSDKETTQRFLCLFGEHLATHGCEIAYATSDAVLAAAKVSDDYAIIGDADVLIVQTAVEESLRHL